MRDFTNLAWPEAPFGADRRPFGRSSLILAAFAFKWINHAVMGWLPICAATAYLRTQRKRTIPATSSTAQIGFRSTVIEGLTDVAALVQLVDRALVRARRHAIALAGDDLGLELDSLARLQGDQRLPGVLGVAEAWANRKAESRGLAVMIDTQHDISAKAALVDVSLGMVPAAIPETELEAERLAVGCLRRCLGIGLTAAAHRGYYRWEGIFPVLQTVEAVAWDRFEHVSWAELAAPAGCPR